MTLRRILAVLAVLGIVACDASDLEQPADVSTLTVIGGDHQTTTPGDTLAPITIVARNAHGGELPGIELLATPTAGSVSPAADRTDDLGAISFIWIMGDTTGDQRIWVRTTDGKMQATVHANVVNP